MAPEYDRRAAVSRHSQTFFGPSERSCAVFPKRFAPSQYVHRGAAARLVNPSAASPLFRRILGDPCFSSELRGRGRHVKIQKETSRRSSPSLRLKVGSWSGCSLRLQQRLETPVSAIETLRACAGAFPSTSTSLLLWVSPVWLTRLDETKSALRTVYRVIYQ